jgi:hypothetical protein
VHVDVAAQFDDVAVEGRKLGHGRSGETEDQRSMSEALFKGCAAVPSFRATARVTAVIAGCHPIDSPVTPRLARRPGAVPVVHLGCHFQEQAAGRPEHGRTQR